MRQDARRSALARPRRAQDQPPWAPHKGAVRDGLPAGSGDKVGVNPLLGPLANNGGPTATAALLAGSPAIEAGNNATCPPTDRAA
jgi:hypothetical protein